MINHSRFLFEKQYEVFVWFMRALKAKFKGWAKKGFSKQEGKILLVGNGPSTKDADLLLYKKEGYQILCVNFFAIKDDRFDTIKPEFYCIMDPYIFDKSRKDICNAELLKKITEISWEMTLVIPAGCKVKIENENVSVFFLNRNKFFGDVTPWWSKRMKRNQASIGAQNVIASALYYAISSEFSEISLVGVEHDMHKELLVDENNIVYRQLKHSYGTELLNVIEYGDIGKGEIFRYFYYFYETFLEYSKLAIYAKYNGIKVINRCKDSFIDVFEKQ